MLLGYLCLCHVFQTKPAKVTRKYRCSYSSQALLQAYKSVKLKGLTVHTAALQLHVPEQTLGDREKGRVGHTSMKLGSETVFNNEEELTLVEHLEAMCDLGYGKFYVKTNCWRSSKESREPIYIYTTEQQLAVWFYEKMEEQAYYIEDRIFREQSCQIYHP